MVSGKTANADKDDGTDSSSMMTAPATISKLSKIHTPTKFDDLKVELKAGVGGMRHPGTLKKLFLKFSNDLLVQRFFIFSVSLRL